MAPYLVSSPGASTKQEEAILESEWVFRRDEEEGTKHEDHRAKGATEGQERGRGHGWGQEWGWGQGSALTSSTTGASGPTVNAWGEQNNAWDKG